MALRLKGATAVAEDDGKHRGIAFAGRNVNEIQLSVSIENGGDRT